MFGYGSLMWRPGFAFETSPAVCSWARIVRFASIRSSTAAPTEQRGLVLGLDEGGACRGVVFRVGREPSEETLAYLREREQVTDVYVEADRRRSSLLDDSGREVEALCYLVDRSHPQYAGRLSTEDQAAAGAIGGKGQSGTNIDYVLNTCAISKRRASTTSELMALAARLSRLISRLFGGRPRGRLLPWSAPARRRNSPACRTRPPSPRSSRSSRRPPIRQRW